MVAAAESAFEVPIRVVWLSGFKSSGLVCGAGWWLRV